MTPTNRRAHSYLFVPGNRPSRLQSAVTTGAHMIIVDLEDSVSPQHKAQARHDISAWSMADHRILLRINASDTEWFEDDVQFCSMQAVDAIVLPKTRCAEDVALVRDKIGASVKIYPMIENACGLIRVLEIADSPGVVALIFGSLDFQVDARIADGDRGLLVARSQIVYASRAVGVDPPIDGITVAVDDVEQISRDARRAKALGFGGKLCIHPRQIDIINDAFRPSESEISWARRVVAGSERSEVLPFIIDGQMVDAPVVLRARQILEQT